MRKERRQVQVQIQGTALIGFPSDNWWNLDISNAPVDPNSAAYIAFIGATRALHPDFGGLGGIPYVVVDDATPKVAVQFGYSDESDGVDHSTMSAFRFIRFRHRRSRIGS